MDTITLTFLGLAILLWLVGVSCKKKSPKETTEMKIDAIIKKLDISQEEVEQISEIRKVKGGNKKQK